MCGIYGFFDLQPGLADGLIAHKQRMNMLHERGPDDQGWLAWSRDCGVLSDPQAEDVASAELFMGHTRLSILDLSGLGRQPMSSKDGRYHMVFNGEIYNYRELRDDLSALGYDFITETDSEVLLYAFAQWGKDMLNSLTGMFAVAIYDMQLRRLFLARDQFGIKPLYYTLWDGGMAFASELAPLLSLPNLDKSLNPQKVYDYLQFGLTDNDTHTLLSSVKQLKGAHWLEYDLDSASVIDVQRYWKIDSGKRLDISFEDAAKRMRELFLESVDLHLRSDVPVGAALSGGIDSSAIVCCIRYLQPEADIHTFTYIADSDDLSEEKWADIVGKHVGATMHKVHPKPEEMLEDLDHLINCQGEPFGSTSIYAQYRVFRLAKEAGIKVMLDGQGADELFGGYSGYAGARLASLLWQLKLVKAWEFVKKSSQWPGRSKGMVIKRALNYFVPAAIQPMARKLVGRELLSHWLVPEWFRKYSVSTFVPEWKPFGRNCLKEELIRSMEHMSVPSLLRYEDRNSMAHSIESRVPFLTTKLAEFVYSLPEEYLIDQEGQSKTIFREAMRGIVPDVILDRRDKIGFATPEYKWLGLLNEWVSTTLPKSEKLPMLNRYAVEAEWQEILKEEKTFGWHIWRMLNFIRWCDSNEISEPVDTKA